MSILEFEKIIHIQLMELWDGRQDFTSIREREREDASFQASV